MRYIICILFLTLSLEASFTRVGNNWSEQRYAPTLSVQEHFDRGYQLLSDKEWEEALCDFLVIGYHFNESPFYGDSIYYAGVCYYFLAHFDIADKYFSHYLNLGGSLKHFEKVFEFKYFIAEYYREGRKKHPFGIERLPRIASGKKNALELYDEVIASLPSREIAAKALYSKALFQRKKKEFKEGIESLQTLIRRFPTHHLAAEAYLTIGDIYLQQTRREAQNPDLIALAQINAQHFAKSFPGDERIQKMDNCIISMEEVYAESLYDTARFFERMKKPQASAIYYQETLNRYPHTKIAQKSQERLDKIK